jgi:hypothetical protein
LLVIQSVTENIQMSKQQRQRRRRRRQQQQQNEKDKTVKKTGEE